MPPIRDCLTRLLPLVPGCPAPVAENHLRLAAIEFCRRTLAWVEVQDAETLQSTDFPYEVAPYSRAKVVKVLSAAVDGVRMLEEITIRQAERDSATWRTTMGSPLQFVEVPRGTVIAVPLPDLPVSFVFTVALEPATDATDIPDEIWNEHQTVLVSGAAAMLSVLPQTTWTSGEMFTLHSTVFRNGIDDAKRNLHLHFSRPVLTTSPSPI